MHLVGSTRVLYDLTSTWLTGRCCELAARGHSRDGKREERFAISSIAWAGYRGMLTSARIEPVLERQG